METIQVQQHGDVFSCDIGISKEEWLEILQDNGLPDNFKDALLRFYYMPKHRGTCTAASNKMGSNAHALNILITKFGNRVQKRFAHRFEVLGTDGKPSRWIIPMNNGKTLSNNEDGSFEWELRSELAEAIREYLYIYLVEKYKELRREISIRDDKKDWDELYKWELITSCEGLTPLEVVKKHITNPNKSPLGGFSNLIDAARDNTVLKYVFEKYPNELAGTLNRLADESQPLNNRLADYKQSMSKILIGKGFNSKANDERIAATILTCLYPDKYTFYKHDDVYVNLCKYLGEDTQKTGLCYSHFLSLLTPLTKIVSTDSELQKLVSPMLEGQRQSNLLIAQDIVWMIIRSLPQRLGYIYDILNNKNKEMNTTDNISKYIELLETNKNLILTGAPGTGKTYIAKAIAEEMGAEWEFVQFHPSYDYTDFVEGLRPKNGENGSVSFERKDGVFKEFCKRTFFDSFTEDYRKTTQSSESSSYTSTDSLEKALQHFKNDLKNKITIEIPSFRSDTIIKVKLNEFGRISVPDKSNWRVSDSKLLKYLRTGKYHHNDTYTKSIGDYIVQNYTLQHLSNVIDKSVSNNSKNLIIEHPDVIMSDEAIATLKDNKNLYSRHSFVFIIDEINRGEISKIFGELFFSIDPGYRGEKGRVQTQYQNMIENDDVFKDGFYVPENVYIIGTMNDIDRSVESMDFAMRRRFAWQEVTAEESYFNMIEDDTDFVEVKDEIKQRMFNLNKAIAETEGLNEAYQIGAAYFRKVLDYINEEQPFVCLWNNHLKGLLFEYLRGNRKAKELLEKLYKAYNMTVADE